MKKQIWSWLSFPGCSYSGRRRCGRILLPQKSQNQLDQLLLLSRQSRCCRRSRHRGCRRSRGCSCRGCSCRGGGSGCGLLKRKNKWFTSILTNRQEPKSNYVTSSIKCWAQETLTSPELEPELEPEPDDERATRLCSESVCKTSLTESLLDKAWHCMEGYWMADVSTREC